MWARWSRFVVERALNPADLIALVDEITGAGGGAVAGHYAVLDDSRTTFATLSFKRSHDDIVNQPDRVGTADRVLRALSNQSVAASVTVLDVISPPENMIKPMRAAVVEVSLPDAAPRPALVELAAQRRAALAPRQGFRDLCLLADPDRPDLLQFSFWDDEPQPDDGRGGELIASVASAGLAAEERSAATFTVLSARPPR